MFEIFLRLANTWAGRKLVGWIFARMSFAIPAKLLHETETILAFHHPKPAYPFHIVLVPKQTVLNLMELDPDSTFLPNLFATVQSLVAEFQLSSYRLIVNGGEYQDFPQLHFHLISTVEATDQSPLPK